MVNSPPCTCSSQTCLDFVSDQAAAILVSDSSQLSHVSIRWNDNSAFTLDRLYDDSGNLFAYSCQVLNCSSCSFCITVFNVLYLLDHRDIVFSVSTFTSHGDSAH